MKAVFIHPTARTDVLMAAREATAAAKDSERPLKVKKAKSDGLTTQMEEWAKFKSFLERGKMLVHMRFVRFSYTAGGFSCTVQQNSTSKRK
jgi:hypothetical protein